MIGRTPSARAESSGSMRHMMANIVTRLSTADRAGSSASLMITDTQLVSPVTRLIESPTDLRLWKRSESRCRWPNSVPARSYTIRCPNPMLAYDVASPSAHASTKSATVPAMHQPSSASRVAGPGSSASTRATAGGVGLP
jgi:hypothetical protein